MINLVEQKDIEWMASELDKINERTKKHTIEIKELKKQIKKLK